MDGRCCRVVVVMGRIEGYVRGAIVGEGLVVHLLGLGLGVAQVGGYVRVVGVLLLSVQVFEVVRHGSDSRSVVVGVFVGCVGVDWVVLVMVVVMGCRLCSVSMPVGRQVVMVHGWHRFDVAAVKEIDVGADDSLCGGLMRGVVGTRGLSNVACGVVGGVSRSLVVHEIVVRLGVVG